MIISPAFQVTGARRHNGQTFQVRRLRREAGTAFACQRQLSMPLQLWSLRVMCWLWNAEALARYMKSGLSVGWFRYIALEKQLLPLSNHPNRWLSR